MYDSPAGKNRRIRHRTESSYTVVGLPCAWFRFRSNFGQGASWPEIEGIASSYQTIHPISLFLPHVLYPAQQIKAFETCWPLQRRPLLTRAIMPLSWRSSLSPAHNQCRLRLRLTAKSSDLNRFGLVILQHTPSADLASKICSVKSGDFNWFCLCKT